MTGPLPVYSVPGSGEDERLEIDAEMQEEQFHNRAPSGIVCSPQAKTSAAVWSMNFGCRDPGDRKCEITPDRGANQLCHSTQ
mmetsp:Transcript_16927/g.34739  ORF Transcript_16927/g.34739 Transcript_16927/m.34739 type:complete len:82 (-) Transcript_16927:68-313(-)